MSANLLYDGINDALLDAFSVAGQTFIWNGQPYDCIVNAESNTLVTAKSLFAASGFPKPGNIIRLANKDRQIKAIANDAPEYVAGGLASDTTFVDDPANPALRILFDSFVGK